MLNVLCLFVVQTCLDQSKESVLLCNFVREQFYYYYKMLIKTTNKITKSEENLMNVLLR